MTGEEFLKQVAYHGAENIAAIKFDNSANKRFLHSDFSIAENYIPELESVCYYEEDVKQQKFLVVVPTSNIQAVLVQVPGSPKKNLSERFVGF